VTDYKQAQKEAKASARRAVAVWPASRGQAFRLDKVGQPQGKAAIKAAKKARTRFLRGEMK